VANAPCLILLVAALAPIGGKHPDSSATPSLDAIKVTTSEPQVLFTPTDQFRYFPDEAIAVLRRRPFEALITVSKSTWLFQGSSIEQMTPQAEVLVPGGPGSFDNGYVGVGGVIERRGEILAFYHAEDHEQMGKISYNDVHAFYASIGLAISTDGGQSFEKRGPILTSRSQKQPGGSDAQGIGDVSVCLSKDRSHLLAYFSDWTDMKAQGTQISLARSKLASADKPKGWKKWHKDDFSEPGMGGSATPVIDLRSEGADAHAPHVQYLASLGCYVATYCVLSYADFESHKPDNSGIALAFSTDGIHWPRRELVYHAMTVPRPGDRITIHPTLIIEKTSKGKAEGWLVSGYSPSWGHDANHPPHHLAGMRIVLSATSS
jgi:hypothetical protein